MQGRDAYRVELSAGASGLRFRCTCPVGLEGAFCKHCVAVALCWLDSGTPPAASLDREVREHLLTLGSEELVDLVIDTARQDPRVAEGLQARAITAADSPDAGALEGLVERAFAVHGFVPYREMWGYIGGINTALDAIEGFLDRDRGLAAISLIEAALRAAERALGHVDYSDGQMGGVIERLEELHLAACRHARPEPIGLAERLLAWELDGEWDVFDQAVLRYSEVLGAPGIARYRELAEERWDSVPALGPGDNRGQSFGERFRITRIMEALAELDGDLAQIVAVRARDLSSPYAFLRLAEVCAAHGDRDGALEWAARGMREFERADPRLRAFLADRYRECGRADEALELSWEAFSDRPGLETYKQLATDAEPLGEWPASRERAQALLIELSWRQADRESGRAWGPPRDRSELVRIALWEQDEEAAWRHACDGGCSDDLWLALAARRRAEHPENALAVYQRQVEVEISGRNRDAYRRAVQTMGEVRTVLEEMGRGADFAAFVAEVRQRHKRKRNLVKLLDGLA
ncbi:MAG: SWIM zinc finger family protein [Solirubrobacterales bacterium]